MPELLLEFVIAVILAMMAAVLIEKWNRRKPPQGGAVNRIFRLTLTVTTFKR